MRPFATWTASSITRKCSSCDSVGDSPVVPTGTTPVTPPATCASINAAKAASSSWSFRNGVTSAVKVPANINSPRFLCMGGAFGKGNLPSSGLAPSHDARFLTSMKLPALLLTVTLATASADLAIKSGEKIGFLGDSITQQGWGSPQGYVKLVVAGLEANGVKVEPIPAGISGHKS